jgi:hypothetical protein
MSVLRIGLVNREAGDIQLANKLHFVSQLNVTGLSACD